MTPPRRDPYGLAEQTTLVHGRPVRSLTAGVLDPGPDVVFLPGLGAMGYLVPWARRTAAWTRATLLDLPGWRRGGARSCDPTLDQVARTTVEWLDSRRRHDVVLVGHSTGAQVALRAAATAGDRVVGLVLAGPTFAPDARTLPAAARRALATVRHERPGVAEVALPSYLRSGGGPLLRFVRSALDDRPEDRLRALDVPVLVMTGREDPFCPLPWAERVATLAGTVCHVMDGGHTAQYGDPASADALVRRAVAGWTQRTGRTG